MNWSYRPKTQTSGIPHARFGHLALHAKKRVMVKGRERTLQGLEHAMRRGKVTTQDIFTIFGDTGRSYRFK
jgi:hypothetical protein